MRRVILTILALKLHNRTVLNIPLTLFMGLISALFLSPTTLAEDDNAFQTKALISVLANHNNSDVSWLDHGLGRFAYRDESSRLSMAGEANIEFRYRFNDKLDARVSLQGYASSSDTSLDPMGLTEYELRYRHNFDFNHQLQIKAGQFFLPTSMENIDAFWESPYTIHFSSLNSWIGEEFRPIGLDARYRFHFNSGERLTVGLTGFGGNDSMGALLAYRGWSYGRVRTTYGDVLALPRTQQLSDAGLFGDQRDDGTKPFGRDLDDRIGIAARVQYSTRSYQLNAAFIDNMGDAALHRGEYAWRTRFTILGASVFLSDRFEVISEASVGDTEMGAGPGVAIDFYSAYVMPSYRFDEYRLSYRYDVFGANDKDPMDDENNDFGRSQTFALMWEPSNVEYRGGLEVLYLDSDRDRKLESLDIARESSSVSVSFFGQLTF